MRIVLTSHGSTGDIFPLIAAGVALREAGHDLCFATSPVFRREIEAAGLRFFELPPRWSQEELAHWMGRLQLFKTPLMQLREMYRAAQPHVTDLIDAMDAVLPGADILVSSCLFPMHRSLAARHGVRFATFAFAHNTVPSRHYPPDGLPRLRGMPLRVQQVWNRTLWRVCNLAVDATINQTIGRRLRARGLPAVKDFFSKPAELVLVGVSPALMRPPFRLHPRFRFVGYCRWQVPPSVEAELELEAFTGGKRVPVLTFGSMVYHDPEAWMRRFLAAWPRERRIVVQRGWSGFEIPSGHDHVRLVGPMAHDQLFRHASVVIHHGGAGTTASALVSGRPQIVVPHIADQGFFSHEIRRLGCGVRLFKRHWPERLARTVARVEGEPSLLLAAERARVLLQREDGTREVVREIEAFVGASQPPAAVAREAALR